MPTFRSLVPALIYALSVMLAVVVPAGAQDFPNRAIRIIVPFPAGGPTDILSRIVAQKMSESFGQPVVVENRPGADTAIGATQVARAAPDGYTVLAAMDTTLVLNPATKASLPYDPFKDFSAISLAAKNTSLLTVRAEDGPKTIPELIALGKAKGGAMNYGAGIITTRLAGYLFNREAGISAQLIPYKGSAEVVQGLLTGAVDYIVDGTASSLPLITSGKFRALAKLNNRPLPALPNVPSLAVAAGMPALDDMSSWIAFVAPAGTPRAVIDRLQAEVAKAYADPATAEKLERAGINAVSSTPQEFDVFFREEAVRWDKAFRESGIKLD
ncbi:MAG TPA: tripartite tricarboxylate transporter substrate binding protein [Xanthobacteraceae bacterium]|jgi:tripartite-type tricarboxylate transporter receptor subunit TctC|nr:tripartite tricarboxylate transporter substrate binding protein [Xanthobacteraceae bacterium]